MKLMDESGIERTVRGNICGGLQTAAACCGGLQKTGLASLRRWRNLVGTKILVALEIRAVLAKHNVWSLRGRSIKLHREGNLNNAHVRTGDVTQELAPVEPAEESWTRMEFDDGQRDKQEESEDQPEELRRVLEARQPTELERQKHSQMNHAVFAPWCEVCVKAKGTGTQHRRQTNKELAKQEQYAPRIYSDFFYMSEEGVLTPMLALKRWDCHLFDDGEILFWNGNLRMLWRSEQYWPNTVSRQSLHRSSHPRRAGPGWTWIREIMTSKKKLINLSIAGLQIWRGRSIFR